ncbi:MAG: hypothetical protein A3F17_02150 [Gammaproteobacteria bacterium RIFCSPHIGHO2_12_FULL_41_15]|nr:MAG: hypothetical protein A3F17_02150 [Gammaproteobacteria bacterium RIFCSPHIGHO2_12_FULL_41_15]
MSISPPNIQPYEKYFCLPDSHHDTTLCLLADYEKIISQPFCQKLMTGELSHSHFDIFLQQDTIYLQTFIAAHQNLLPFTREDELFHFLQKAIDNGIQAETELLNTLSTQTTIAPPNLITQTYCQHLLKATRINHPNQFYPALASLLPCYWIYGQWASDYFNHHPNIENIYHTYFLEYQRLNLSKDALFLKKHLEKEIPTLNAQQKNDLKHNYYTSCYLEKSFFSACYTSLVTN